jgi:hypothetical protein
MENLPVKKVYTLYLNSNTGFRGLINNSDYANVSWLVDWDSLFNRENYLYKYCAVRFRMVGEINTGIQDNNQTLGVLAANFGATFSGKNAPYVVLGSLDLKPVASFTTPTYTNVGNMIDTETMTHAQGQQIDMPIGLTTLNLQLWKDAFGCNGDANNTLVASSSTHQYYIIFQFELC